MRQAQRRRAHQTGVVWRDPLAGETDAMVAGWRASRQVLPAGERQLSALFDAALEAYGARPHPGESIYREPGASRFRTWLARLEDVWGAALEFLDTFGFVEDVRTPWVALHHAYGFDDRVPHDADHCGLCLVRSDPARAIGRERVLSDGCSSGHCRATWCRSAWRSGSSCWRRTRIRRIGLAGSLRRWREASRAVIWTATS